MQRRAGLPVLYLMLPAFDEQPVMLVAVVELLLNVKLTSDRSDARHVQTPMHQILLHLLNWQTFTVIIVMIRKKILVSCRMRLISPKCICNFLGVIPQAALKGEGRGKKRWGRVRKWKGGKDRGMCAGEEGTGNLPSLMGGSPFTNSSLGLP
jgi:hypothetical protein